MNHYVKNAKMLRLGLIKDYIPYTLYLISYILFISLVERIQLFSRAVCPKRVGDVSWA